MSWSPDIFGVRAAQNAVADAQEQVRSVKALVIPLMSAVASCKPEVISQTHVAIPADQWLRILSVIADHKADK